MVKADLIKNGEFEKICNLTKEAKKLAKSIAHNEISPFIKGNT